MMGCGNCDWWDKVSDFSGICTCPDGRNCGEYVGISESCGKWIEKIKKTVPVKAEPEETKAEYAPDPERLDPTFLIQSKLCKLMQDSECPAWIWFPNNAEMLKLAEYLVAKGVTFKEECLHD